MALSLSFVTFTSMCGLVLTPAQRVIATIAIDGAEPHTLEGEDRELATKLFGPIDVIPVEARAVLVVLKGARSGGTLVFGGLYSLWRMLVADLDSLASGEVATALVVAPDMRLGRQVRNYALGAATKVPSIARRITATTADGFVLKRPDGREVELGVLPASRGGSALRGRSLVSAVLSEAAFFRDVDAVVNDVDVFNAVNPRVIEGGLTIVESTPWIEAGLVYDEFAKNFATPRTATVVHAPTLLMRPDDRTRRLVARERARDSANAEREFDAQFITGGSGMFLGPELIGPSIDRDLTPSLAALEVGRLHIGGDIGLVSDASAFMAVKAHEKRLTVIDALELRPAKGKPLKLSDVVAAGCAFAAKHGQKTVLVDHHELIASREHYQHGVTFKPCVGGGDAREDRFMRVREAFRQERVRIPVAFTRLTTQLSLIVSKPKSGGGTLVILPRRAGSHLDLCAAFVLAVDAATTRHTRMFEALQLRVAARQRDGLLGGARWSAR